MEGRRQCKWKAASSGPQRIVWAKGDRVSYECPKGAITGDSIAWLELFATWRLTGKGMLDELSARDADALALLDLELERMRDDQER